MGAFGQATRLLGDPAIVASIVVVVTCLAALVWQVRAGRIHSTGRVVLAMGSLGLVMVATMVPSHWSVTSVGRSLELRPLFGGLGGGLVDLLQQELTADVELLALNVLVYVPVGAALRWAWPHRGAWVLLVPLVLSLAIETVQYVALARTAATDDVIVNVTGALAGYLAMEVAARLRPAGLARSRPGPPGGSRRDA